MLTNEYTPGRAQTANAEPWPPQWMLDLERAHDRLGRAAHLLESGAQAGPVDLRPAADAIERSFAGIFDAYDARRSRLEAVTGAMADLDDATASLSPAASGDAAVGFALDYLREARGALEQARERILPLVHRPREPAPDLHASFERPVLHTVERDSLRPRLRVPLVRPPVVEVVVEPVPRPRTVEELEAAVKELKARAAAARSKPRVEKAPKAPPPVVAEPPPGFAVDVRPAISELDFLRMRVRLCFEEITMIGVQRAPLLGDPWRGSRVLERRMLASVDAIAAIGPPALQALESFVMDAPLKDPSRVFAIALTLGCIEGRDALGMAERVFAAFEVEDPQHAAQLGAALKLVPHPHVPLILRTFLADPDPSRRAMAIDVLACRGLATHDELARAAVDEPAVAAMALPWLAIHRSPMLTGALGAGLESSVLGVRAAARLALLISGDFRAVSALRSATDAEPPEADGAMALLGIVAGPDEVELLLERGGAKPSRPILSALGWAGSPVAIPRLIAVLSGGDDEAALSAAYALDRITHAGLYDSVVVDAEDIVVPDIPDGPADPSDRKPPALARVVSDPRDLPAEPSTDTLQRPTVDPARWQAWWRERKDGFDSKARYRRGSPYTPHVSWRELDLFPCTPGERRLLHWELVARTGEHVRFDPDGLRGRPGGVRRAVGGARETCLGCSRQLEPGRPPLRGMRVGPGPGRPYSDAVAAARVRPERGDAFAGVTAHGRQGQRVRTETMAPGGGDQRDVKGQGRRAQAPELVRG